MLCSSSSVPTSISLNCPVAFNSSIANIGHQQFHDSLFAACTNNALARSKGRSPMGVSYELYRESAQPSMYTWWEGPRMKTRLLRRCVSIQSTPTSEKGRCSHMPVVSMHLYAHAAAGPEYEYPACLNSLISIYAKRYETRHTAQ